MGGTLLRVAILGASGRLGRALRAEFGSRDHQIVAVTRSPAKASQTGGSVTWTAAGSDDVKALHRLFLESDLVVDARNQRYDDWSRYPSMIGSTMRALDGTRARYAYVDNVYLYGRAASAEPLTEEARRQPISLKGRYRLAVEGALFRGMADGRQIVIVRFPDFYGISTDPLTQGRLRWFGPPALCHQFIHVPDAARALRLLATDSDAYQRAWHVAGANPVSGSELARIAANVLGRAVRLQRFSPTAVAVLGLVNVGAHGLRETQYLWYHPLILDTTAFTRRYPSEFIHGHEDALREISRVVA